MKNKKVDGYYRDYIDYMYKEDDPWIKICDHICLFGELREDDEGCEYHSHIQIYCKVCNINYQITEAIN